MVAAIFPRPSPPAIASVSSEIMSPAWAATSVAPRMRSLPCRRWTRRNPSSSPSSTARSTSASGIVSVVTARPRARLVLVEARVRDLGRRICAPRDLQRGRPLPANEQRVGKHDPCESIRGVRELEARGNVAGGVDARVRRPEEIVDGDPAPLVRHPRGLEPEARDVGRPADPDENLIALDGLPRARDLVVDE